MQLGREVQTGIAAEALGWLAPRLLVAGLQRGGTVIVDPLTGEIVHRWPGFSFPDASARTPDSLVMLLPQLRTAEPNLPLTRVAGAPRLAVVDAKGGLRSVTLSRIPLGVRSRNGIPYQDHAALAVDAVRARAYVFAANAAAAAVDLRTMRVSYHRLASGRSGQSMKKVLARERHALLLGDGRVLVFGRDFVPSGRSPFAAVAAGATLVDLGDWTSRVLDPRAGGAAFAAGRLLVYGSRGVAEPGLRSYTLEGRKAFHLFDREQVWDVQTAGSLAYVRTPRALRVVDLTSGKVVSKIVPLVELLDVIVASS